MSVSGDGGGAPAVAETLDAVAPSRKEKRKALKKQKRKQIRRELAAKEREEEETRANDPEEQLRVRLREQEEAEAAERERKAFEERERLWLEAAAARRAEEEQEEEARRKRILEESQKDEVSGAHVGESDDWEYVEDGPAEIIWKGNEIIVKKKQIRVPRRGVDKRLPKEGDDRPTSNPLPPQSIAFDAFNSSPPVSAQEVLESVAQQVPNFGTEQDKAHCPFHLKTGACRFGVRCSRVHFYPDKSCTLLIKNMYNGPGLAWEQDEGLEYTDEEVERCYEEFYEDVHTEFLKFGQLVNFKVCRNSSFHLRGNVYIHYKNPESAILAYNTMNGRYYAGKQITCEFVNISRWKIAICGEYMKSRLTTCSHGTACNFIHCFHNPGGDYEWADWDNPPPRYWVKKMAVLFGRSDEPEVDGELESRKLPREPSKKVTRKSDRYRSRGARYNEMDLSCSSGGDDSDGSRGRSGRGDRYRSQSRRSYSREGRKTIDFADKCTRSPDNHFPEIDDHSEYFRYGCDSDDGILRAKHRGSSRKERKDKERNRTEDHEKHSRKRKSYLSNRSRWKLSADVEENSETTSKYHGQKKRENSLDPDDGSRQVNDRHQRDCHSSKKSDYKYASGIGEDYSQSSRSVDFYSERPHKRNERSDHFDQGHEFKESHKLSRSRHRSPYQKHDSESKFREQSENGKGFSPIESSDNNWRTGATESSKVHGSFVAKRRHRSHGRSEPTDSGGLETSEESSYEREDKCFTTGRKRRHRKREHPIMEEENGGSVSGSM